MIGRFAALTLFAFVATAVFAQNASANKKDSDDTGWTSAVNFEGSANSQERVLDLGSNLGYNFSEHWSADMGVPLSFVSSSSTTTTGTTTTKKTSSLNSLGNLCMDVKYKTSGNFANYNSTLTATAPTGSREKGVSTGRPNIAWNNHAERDFDTLPIGFTFSYPATQDFIDHGVLQRWTKGFDIDGVEGKDVVPMFVAAIEKKVW